MATNIENDPTTIPGYLKTVWPARREGLTYRGKHYHGPEGGPQPQPTTVEGIIAWRAGEPFACSWEEARELSNKRLIRDWDGVEVHPHWSDGFHEYRRPLVAKLNGAGADESAVRAVLLRGCGPVAGLWTGAKLRIFLSEHFGSYRYCSEAELLEFRKSGDVGSEGFGDQTGPWRGKSYKILEPNPKTASPDSVVFDFQAGLHASALAAQNAMAAAGPREAEPAARSGYRG